MVLVNSGTPAFKPPPPTSWWGAQFSAPYLIHWFSMGGGGRVVTDGVRFPLKMRSPRRKGAARHPARRPEARRPFRPQGTGALRAGYTFGPSS